MSLVRDPSAVTLSYHGRYALLTIDNDRKLNALTQAQYYDLGRKLDEIAARDEVYVTILTAKGRYFSAGADVSVVSSSSPATTAGPASHLVHLQGFAALNLALTRSFYTHPKVLVVGLNGPAVGLSAALVALADFVYCAPSAFLLTPFSSLGLVAEGASSRALARRLGPARAGEALLMSRRIEATELERCGFVNRILKREEAGGGDDDDGGDWFSGALVREVEDKLGEHLDGESLVEIKRLMRQPETEALERHNTAEVFAGIERFIKGVPQEQFRKIASGEKRHKL